MNSIATAKGMTFDDQTNGLNKAHTTYEEHFGKGSLEEVVPYFDPVNPELSNVKNGTRILWRAIKNDKPLPKIDPSMRDKIIY